jgi:hypothetical protein
MGSESDIDIALSSKGTGAILAQMPDGTVAGGNKRGNNAVDLQMVRNNATQVAIGTSSTISGGERNATSVDYASIGGGSGNTVNKIGGTIAGGTQNTVTGLQYSAVLGGFGNTASGNRTAIGCGSENETESEYSVVSGGYRNKARADRSAIIGGAELTLSGTATGSFGFNANRISGGFPDRPITIADANTGVFNNVDLWLTNNDNTTRTLRFYEAFNTAGAFPSGANYVAFRAPTSINSNVTWTLPSADGTANQVLKTDGSGNLTWSNDIGKFYFAGRGISISNDSIISTGFLDSTTKGDVIGKFDSLYIKNGSVTDNKIAIGALSTNKLAKGSATDGQVLTWDQAGNVWTPKNSNFSFFATSRDITIPNNTVPAHQIIPIGSESNIDFVISPKGSGSILANLPISGSIDKRGTRAIDLQMQRSNADEVAKGPNSVIAGGRNNKITSAGTQSVIVGGTTNSVSASNATIVGGQLNTASGISSFIGGGIDNDASGEATGIVGGQYNTASSTLAFIGGGANNTVSASNAAIVGGQSNSILSGTHGFIGSGLTNSLNGAYGVIAGGRLNRVSGTYGFIGGGERDTIAGNYSVISGGLLNKVSANYSSILGGFENQALAEFTTINGGDSNIITSAGYGGVIGGGILNRVADLTATVAGGISNQALGRRSTVGGGVTNTARNWYSTVSGGAGNSALAEGSAVFGGIEMVLDTTAIGSFGFNGNIINNSTSLYARRINIAQPRTGVFNNVHLWLTNNDDTVRTLRFYEKYNVQGAFPNGTNYVGFKAPDAIGSDMIYTLPSTAPSANGQVLASTTAGVLSWVNGGGNINDYFEFDDLNPGNQSAIQAHLMRPRGPESDIDMVLSPKGKGSFMFDYPDNSATGGAKRGILSIDLQMVRSTQHQVVKADTASILGGFANEISNSAHTSVIIGGALNTASAYQSTILGGRSNTTDGQFSMVGGLGNTAGSYGETVLGIYATDAGGTTSSSISTDRLFAIGNGTSATRSTAFSILKNGNTNVSGTLDINGNATIGGGSSTSELRLKEASGTGSNYTGFKAGNATADMVYTLPTSAPGSDGQVLISSTSGVMSWSTPILKAQNISVNPGNLVEYGGSQSIAITVTGAQVGATVQVSPRTEMEDGIIIGYARVSAADTVSIRFVNTTNGPIDPTALNIDITVIQP